MAKKPADIQAEYDFLKRDYSRIVDSFDAILLHNGRLVDGVTKAIEKLEAGGVPEHVIEESGLRGLTKRCNYSEILKNAGR